MSMPNIGKHNPIEPRLIVLEFIGQVPSKSTTASISVRSTPDSAVSELSYDGDTLNNCETPTPYNTESNSTKLKSFSSVNTDLLSKTQMIRPQNLILNQSSVDKTDSNHLIDHLITPSESSSGNSGSSRTSIIDMDSNEVTELVNLDILPSFSNELYQELKLVQQNIIVKESNKSISPKRKGKLKRQERVQFLKKKPQTKLSLEVESLEAEVARSLMDIADEINEECAKDIEELLLEISSQPREVLTYRIFKNYISKLLSSYITFSNFKKAALILLLSQQVAFRLIQKGERNLNDLIQFTSYILMEYASEYIDNLTKRLVQDPIIEDSMENGLNNSSMKNRKDSIGFMPLNRNDSDLTYKLNIPQISSNYDQDDNENDHHKNDNFWINWFMFVSLCSISAFLTGVWIRKKFK